MFKRIGKCNLCGECCGSPRKTDGGQNNAWPADWPEALDTWSEESLPDIFKLIDIKRKRGVSYIGNNRFNWMFKKGKGICKSNHNFECPFLSEKLEDGTRPCLLKGTEWDTIWTNSCDNAPPEYFTSIEQVNQWFTNCPSCSFIYEEVP